MQLTFKLPKMLKAHIAHQLAVIINESFSTGLFPDKLKLAKVIPIHKEDSTQNCNDYRRISLLPVFSKIFEKLMHTRLYKFLDEKISYIQTSLASQKTTLLNVQLSLLQRKLKDQLMVVTLPVVYF